MWPEFTAVPISPQLSHYQKADSAFAVAAFAAQASFGSLVNVQGVSGLEAVCFEGCP
jgi:hypothetical protein